MMHKAWAVVCTTLAFSVAVLSCTPEPVVEPPAPEATAVPSPSDEVLVVGSSSGGMVEKLSVEDLTLRAGRILVGTVVDLKSEWNNERTLIYTYVTVTVEDHIRGAPDQMEVTVMVPGGEVGDEGASVSGVAEFSKGEKVLLFLERDEAGTFHVLGGFQGKIVIYGDKVFVEGKERLFTDLVNEIQNTLNRR